MAKREHWNTCLVKGAGQFIHMPRGRNVTDLSSISHITYFGEGCAKMDTIIVQIIYRVLSMVGQSSKWMGNLRKYSSYENGERSS